MVQVHFWGALKPLVSGASSLEVEAGTIRELFSAWLSVPPGVAAGEVLTPSVELQGMVEPVRFRVQLHGR